MGELGFESGVENLVKFQLPENRAFLEGETLWHILVENLATLDKILPKLNIPVTIVKSIKGKLKGLIKVLFYSD